MVVGFFCGIIVVGEVITMEIKLNYIHDKAFDAFMDTIKKIITKYQRAQYLFIINEIEDQLPPIQTCIMELNIVGVACSKVTFTRYFTNKPKPMKVFDYRNNKVVEVIKHSVIMFGEVIFDVGMGKTFMSTKDYILELKSLNGNDIILDGLGSNWYTKNGKRYMPTIMDIYNYEAPSDKR